MRYQSAHRLPRYRGTLTVQDIMREKEDRERQRGNYFLDPPPPQLRAGDDLTLMQRCALLQMMNSTFARGVMTKLMSNEGIQARPSLADYCELSRRFLCERMPGSQYHELTYQGSKLAKAVLTRTCQDLDIHAMQVESVTGSGRDAETYYRCCCGGWGRVFRGNGQFTWRRAANAYHSHHNPLAKGIEG